MRRTILLLTGFIFTLAACTGTAPSLPAETAPVETEGVQATVEPPKPIPAVEATSSPGGDPVAAGGSSSSQTYRIVPGESAVSYEVGETFFQDNRFNLAVGVTTQVTGDVMVDAKNPHNSQIGEIKVDISQFKSDSAKRDNIIQGRFLESGSFPVATFTSTGIEGLPESYPQGEELTFIVNGDLKVRDITQPVSFDVTVTLEDGLLKGVASTTILMSDFGVGPIEIAGILGTEDEIKLIFTFVARI